jgi:hypothetical protein
MDCGDMNDDDCIDVYLMENGFKRYEVPDDGNCFFHALQKFYELTDTSLPKDFPDKPPELYKRLRKYVVDYMVNNRGEYLNYIITPSGTESSKKSKLTKELNLLYKDKVWDVYLGDFIPQETPKALGIRIELHELNDRKISSHTVQNNTNPNSNLPLVHLLRLSKSHFELLMLDEKNAINGGTRKNRRNIYMRKKYRKSLKVHSKRR